MSKELPLNKIKEIKDAGSKRFRALQSKTRNILVGIRSKDNVVKVKDVASVLADKAKEIQTDIKDNLSQRLKERFPNFGRKQESFTLKILEGQYKPEVQELLNSKLEDPIEDGKEDLTEHHVLWNYIINTIIEEEEFEPEKPKLIADAITKITIALNSKVSKKPILKGEQVAEWPGGNLPTDLPNDAVSFVFSEDSIVKLTREIEAAFDLEEKDISKLTPLQVALTDLSNGSMHSKDLIDTEKESLNKLLEIANPS